VRSILKLTIAETVPFILRILGLYLIFTSIPSLIGTIAYCIYDSQTLTGTFGGISSAQIKYDVTLVGTIIIGILLTIGIKRLGKIFISIQEFVEKPPEEG